MGRVVAAVGALLTAWSGAGVDSTPPARVDFPGCPAIVGSLPAWSPDSRRIAYTFDYADGVRTIVVANRDGSGRHDVTDRSNVSGPDWSPDGRTIAFTTDRGIELMNADGTSRRLIARGSDPSWSPDGTQLALIGPYDGSRETPRLDVVNSDGTGRQHVLESRINIHLGAPDWSPDGRWIAYTRTFPGPTAYGGVYIVRVDGSGETPAAHSISAAPDWAPDSRSLIYESWFLDERPAEIHRLDLTTNRELRVTAEPRPPRDGKPVAGSANDEHPAWSPDGRRIVFVRVRAADRAQGALWVVNPDGRAEHPLNPRCRFGTERDDTLRGTPLRDRIYGLEGRDRIRAGRGDDIVVGGAGRDTIACGAGRDTVYARTGDLVGPDCERVVRR